MSTKPGLLHVLFAVSGACALGYELVWTQMFALGLGHELPAVLAVVAAFLGGLALGGGLIDRPINRAPARAALCYAALELMIGFWAVVTCLIIFPANELALRILGTHSYAWIQGLVSFLIPFVVLLPATAAMGATFPVMECFARSGSVSDGRVIGGVYSANTAGAVLGIMATTFWLAPAVGFRGTLVILACLNLACASAAFFLSRCSTKPAGCAVRKAASVNQLGLRLRWTVFLTGFLGIGYEITGLKLLAEVLENTIYSFAATLAVYLLGTAVGAACYQRYLRAQLFIPLLNRLLFGLSAAISAGAWTLWAAPSIYLFLRERMGDSIGAVTSAEMIITLLVFGPATILMGATFSHLVQWSRQEDGGAGRAAALNTMGGALAPVLLGAGLYPLAGGKVSLAILVLGYLVLVMGMTRKWILPVAGLAAMTLTLPNQLHAVRAPPNGSIVEYRPGRMDSAAVVRHFDGHRSLLVNNRFIMGGTGATNAARRHAHIPLLLHREPKNALFLGLGTGITFAAAGAHGLRADGVELLPEVVDLLHHFRPENSMPMGLNVHVADARRFVRTAPDRYDVIVADLFHPAREGAGALYTIEHFRALRERLAPGGVFCQWLPLFQLDESVLRVITQTFIEVFPNAQAFLLRFNIDTPVVGLIATDSPFAFTETWLSERVTSSELSQALKPVALMDEFQLFGCFLAGSRALQEFAAGARLNTDDRPVVMFQAPRFAYQRKENSYDRLLVLLRRFDREPIELFAPGTVSTEFMGRLEGFVRARNVYVYGLVDEAENRPDSALSKFLESARLSADFSTGYAQCITTAMRIWGADPVKARSILQELMVAQPGRTLAGELLRRMDQEKSRGDSQ